MARAHVPILARVGTARRLEALPALLRGGSRATAGPRTCAECGYIAYASPEPTVCALVLDDAGRVLLARRKFEPEAGKWDVPGGFLEEDEEPLDGLRRELREEAGVEIEPLELAGIWADRYGGGDDAYGHAQSLLDGAHRLRRADSGRRRRRAPLVLARRPAARRGNRFRERREGATFTPMKRLLVAVVVVLALAPGAGAAPGGLEAPARDHWRSGALPVPDGTEVRDQARLPRLAAGHDVGEEDRRCFSPS